MTFRPKKTTATTLIVELLRQRDDFMSKAMLVEALTGRATKHQIDSALPWLRQVRAIDVIIENDGTSWWYALPPEHDVRVRQMEEMAIHERLGARKPRRRKIDLKP
jgi:hypothetical protein